MTSVDPSGDGLPFNNIFESRNAVVSGMDSLFLDSNAKRGFPGSGVGDSYDRHDVAANFLSGEGGLSSSLPRHYDAEPASSRFDGFDRAAIGENLIRSHSAAPTFDGRVSLGPPPGLANRETPVISNRVTNVNPGDSYLMDSALDRSRIIQMGQRRPASTGVIGQSQNPSSSVLNSLGLGSMGSGAVRPAAKTLMDLIQEDVPDPYMQGDVRDGYSPRDSFEQERPRTTSPLSMHRDHYSYGNSYNGDSMGRDGRSGLSHALDRLQIRPGDPYGSSVRLLYAAAARFYVLV